ncbi:MAG: ATP-dependent DNA ligase [Acidobacteriaceae bacterium]
MPSRRKSTKDRIAEGAVTAESLAGSYPDLNLPLRPPYPPMEARLVDAIPRGKGWQYEPKWDGFRCLIFRDGEKVALQSKAGQPLGRYFPEIVRAVATLPQRRFVLDGEIVILRDGHIEFDELLMRIHPAESRIKKLSLETPGTLFIFDLLVDEERNDLTAMPLDVRRPRLEQFFEQVPEDSLLRLSPKAEDIRSAERWMEQLGSIGLDGVIAKRLDVPYASGERTAMQKIKLIRTADCVVGGFRWASKGGKVGSLLLGLYDEKGLLNHIGFTSSFTADERDELKRILKPYMNGSGFSGAAPGGPSRWSTERSGQWEPLDPKLVCEVRYDHFSGGRFRHGTKFLRWRPEKRPRDCTYDQVTRSRKGKGLEKLLAA